MLEDAEGFQEILFAVERLGSMVSGRIESLHTYAHFIKPLALESSLSEDVPAALPALHRPFSRLYELVQRARNDALHQGAYARHLASHAVELAIMLEDALMADARLVGDFMVKSPVCAQPWQPLSYVRQQMLENSYSFLPIQVDGADGWRLISDAAVARVVRGATSKDDRTARLTASVSQATTQYGLSLIKPQTVPFDMPVTEVLKQDGSTPALVFGRDGDLVGIVTPFDLL
ncbi:MAG: hypothetical protein U0Q55_21210 [Vicinamibacterales bacterium]